MSKNIAKFFSKVLVFGKEHARQITLVFAVIGLICVGLWIVTHFWGVIKFCLGVLALGLVCGGLSRR